jgi:hypothetical protein
MKNFDVKRITSTNQSIAYSFDSLIPATDYLIYYYPVKDSQSEDLLQLNLAQFNTIAVRTLCCREIQWFFGTKQVIAGKDVLDVVTVSMISSSIISERLITSLTLKSNVSEKDASSHLLTSYREIPIASQAMSSASLITATISLLRLSVVGEYVLNITIPTKLQSVYTFAEISDTSSYMLASEGQVSCCRIFNTLAKTILSSCN